MSLAIGVDVGTTGARAVAVDEGGAVEAAASSAYPLHTPRPQWTEQDPADWWAGVCEVLGRVAAELGKRASAIVGVGLTGQMHGSVFVDAAGEVIRPAILWNDQRTGAECAEITERVGSERLLRITGNPALTGFQAPKVLWLRNHEPEQYRRIAHVLLPKDHTRLLLTGELATDASDAAGTLFLDLAARSWSPEVLEALEVPSTWLPPVIESPVATGALRGPLVGELGLPAGLPIAAGGGDNAAAAVGTATVREGLVSSSIGTSGVLFSHVDRATADPSGRIHAFCDAVPGGYCLLGVTLSAGGSLRWWRDLTGRDYDALVAEAEGIPPGAEGLLFVPYLTGERTPHLDPDARGAFVGLTARHTMAHMTRAIMEGVVFGLREALDIVCELGIRATEIRVTGGGGRSPLWRRLQADVYGLPIRRLRIEEGAAYGAALLGHVVGGTFADVAEVASIVGTLGEPEEPDPAAAARYCELFGEYRKLYPSMSGAMHRLSALARG